MRSVVLCNDTGCIIGQHAVAYGDMADWKGPGYDRGVHAQLADYYIPGFLQPYLIFLFFLKSRCRLRVRARGRWVTGADPACARCLNALYAAGRTKWLS